MERPNGADAGATLLIVEDDILPAMVLRDELTEAGYDVMELTATQEDGLLAARTRKPDLALVNIELQGRDDGIALACDLKALGIPVLFISGQVSRARSAKTVAVGSLPKPYSVDDMVKAVAYLLRHLNGGEPLEKPEGLEVFVRAPNESVPDAA